MATDATIVTQIIRNYNLQNYHTVSSDKPNPYSNNPNITASEKDKPLYLSSLGTPVFTDFTFEEATLNDGRKTPVVKLVTVLLSVSLSKNIIVTQIPGSNLTVKEYIGQDDYHVTINGIITGTNGHHPIDEVYALKQVLDALVPIPVTSKYLQNLGIYELVVKDYTFDQEPGGYSQQGFSINALSNVPIELQMYS